ncbi:MAG: hypothetical protein JXB17_12635 [Bacteroidales bacterium]|nr:hypothetical protein [Bacteroidales bacterium]
MRLSIIFLIVILIIACHKKDTDIDTDNTLGWEPLSEKPLVKIGKSAGDPSVLYIEGDENPWKMWFGYAHFIVNESNEDEMRAETGFAESTDGIKWEVSDEPVLKTSSPGGWDHKTAEVPCVIYDEGENDNTKKYKMWYSGRNLHDFNAKDFRYGIGYAYSSDGIKWEKLPKNESPYNEDGLILLAEYIKKFPGIPIHVSEPEVIKNNGIFEMWHVVWAADSMYTHGIEAYIHSTSTDGINWLPDSNNLIFADSEDIENPGNGIGQLAVLKNNSGYEMYYTVEKANNDNSLEHLYIKHLISKDGINWGSPEIVIKTENVSPFWLGPGIDIIEVNNNIFLFYSGFDKNVNDGFYIYGVKKK